VGREEGGREGGRYHGREGTLVVVRLVDVRLSLVPQYAFKDHFTKRVEHGVVEDGG
jgi:hypothetical protein